MAKTKQEEIVATIAASQEELFDLLKTLSGYDDMCECDNQIISGSYHDYGEEYEICLSCGGMINMC